MQRDAFENFNPEDFLQLAKELENNLANLEVNESSIYRTIFGRIYYAIFLYVRNGYVKILNINLTHKENIKECLILFGLKALLTMF